MTYDSNGGVCLKKNYSFYTFDNSSNSTGHTNTNIYTGEYIILMKNTNNEYSIDIEDSEICFLLPTGDTITGWTESYINAYVISGDSEQYKTEDRVIFSQPNNSYYKIIHTGSTEHLADVGELYAVIDNNTNELWDGTTDYKYEILDECENPTGLYAVKLKNLNEKSKTAYKIINYTI